MDRPRHERPGRPLRREPRHARSVDLALGTPCVSPLAPPRRERGARRERPASTRPHVGSGARRLERERHPQRLASHPSARGGHLGLRSAPRQRDERRLLDRRRDRHRALCHRRSRSRPARDHPFPPRRRLRARHESAHSTHRRNPLDRIRIAAGGARAAGRRPPASDAAPLHPRRRRPLFAAPRSGRPQRRLRQPGTGSLDRRPREPRRSAPAGARPLARAHGLLQVDERPRRPRPLAGAEARCGARPGRGRARLRRPAPPPPGPVAWLLRLGGVHDLPERARRHAGRELAPLRLRSAARPHARRQQGARRLVVRRPLPLRDGAPAHAGDRRLLRRQGRRLSTDLRSAELDPFAGLLAARSSTRPDLPRRRGRSRARLRRGAQRDEPRERRGVHLQPSTTHGAER